MPGRPPCGQNFEYGSDFERLRKVAFVQRRHEGAAARCHDDPALVLKSPQTVVDRGAAHGKALRELSDVESCTGLELAGQNVFSERVGDEVGEAWRWLWTAIGLRHQRPLATWSTAAVSIDTPSCRALSRVFHSP